jgi:signal transduction histidine kinase/ligand-binding sensor domain-containing protein
MRLHSILITLTGLLACVHISYAQQYFFAQYTPKNGLVNNRALALYQDSKGRLYICTFGGLSVYDGARFINYTTEDGLITSLVNDVVEMGDDSLWIIPNGAGLHALVHGILRNIVTADHFYPVINQLIRGSDGYYYALADQGFFRWERDRFVRIPLTGGSGKDSSLNLLQGVEWNGQLFLVSQPYSYTPSRPSSLIVYDLATRRCLTAPNTPTYYCAVVTPFHDILVATDEGVRKVDPAALQQHEIRLLPPPFPYDRTGALLSTCLYFDRGGNLWLVCGKEIVRIGRGGDIQTLGGKNGLPPGQILSILQDQENNIWFTNEQNGLIKLVSRYVEFFTQPEPGFTVTDISARDNSDSVWFYDRFKKTLLLMKGNIKKIYRGSGVVPEANHVLIGRWSYMITGKEIYTLHFLARQRYRASLLFRDTTMIDGNACFDKRGNLILPTQNKLTVVVDGKILQRRLSHLADQAAVDKYNRIWVITRSNELSVYRIAGSAASPFLELLCRYPRLLPDISPRSMTIDGEGHLWVGTRDHGLYCLFFDGLRLVSYRQISMADGLAENFIVNLLCDTANNVLACTPTGLDKIRFSKGHFLIDDVTPCNDMYQRLYKILPSAPGLYWVAARDGFMKISPSMEEKSSYIPSVLFSKVLVGDKAIPDSTNLSLPYDSNTISFYIGTPTFVEESRTRYSYLLEGSPKPAWSTPSIQSAINFVNLPPGKYTLRVSAQFPTGLYPAQSAAYSFVIRPPWWQTWWFRSAAILVLAAIVLLSIKSYTRRRLDKQRIALEKKQAIEKERTRIATDMHDDLGAGLSRIKFLSETIGIKKQQQLPIEEEITGIREYSHEMIDKMGEIVWALNEKNDSLSDLLSYTRSYAAEYLMQAGIRCTVEAPGDFPCRFVSGEFRRNIYLTIKEALHNVVKHAEAERVDIRMEVGRELAITIQDDGTGFDGGQIRPFSNGLYNMQKRIRDIGGTLSIRSGPGTTLHLSVPL